MTKTRRQPTRHPGGRPRKSGREVRINLRLREGEHDEVLARLDRIPPGQKSTYIRRVLAGAPVEVLDQAIKETKFVAGLLDGMWDDEWDDRVGDLEDRLSKK